MGIFYDKKDILIIIMCIEIILLCVDLNFITFSSHLDDFFDQIFFFLHGDVFIKVWKDILLGVLGKLWEKFFFDLFLDLYFPGVLKILEVGLCIALICAGLFLIFRMIYFEYKKNKKDL